MEEKINNNPKQSNNNDMHEAMKAYVAAGGGTTYKNRDGFWRDVWLTMFFMCLTWLSLAVLIAGLGALNFIAIGVGLIGTALFGKLSLKLLHSCSEELNSPGIMIEGKLSLGQKLVKRALKIKEV